MVEHLIDLIKKTRRHVGEHEDRPVTANDTALAYVQDAIEIVCARIVKMDDRFFSAYYDIALNGALSYALPLGVVRIAGVEDITGGATNPRDTFPLEFVNRFLHIRNYLLTSNIRYTFKDGKIYIPSKQSGNTVRVYYPQRPKRLFYMTADSVTSTAVTCTTDPESGSGVGKIIRVKDYYVGMYMVDITGEFHEITANTALGVFTCGTWITTPTIVSLAVPMDPRFNMLLHMEAGILWRVDLDDAIGDLKTITDIVWAELELLLAHQNTHRGDHVTRTRR